MDETELQEIFSSYLKSENQMDRGDAIKKFSVIIYNYSKKIFFKDNDDSSDFFMHLYPQLTTLIESYDITRDVTIKTYLTYRLQNLFRTFLKKIESKKSYLQFFPIDETHLYEKNFSPLVRNPSSTTTQENLEKSIETLPKLSAIIIKLYFGLPLSLSDCRYLKEKNLWENFSSQFKSLKEKIISRKEKNEDQHHHFKKKLTHYNTLMQTHPHKKQFFLERYNSLLEKRPAYPSVIKLKELSKLLDISLSMLQRVIKTSKNIIAKEFAKLEEEENERQWI